LRQRYLVNVNVPPIDTDKPLTLKQAGELQTRLLDPFYPRFWEEKLYHPWGGKPKGIFVCDMSDLFGIGIPEQWTKDILNLARLHEENRYYLLTKQPQNLIKFSPFPDNCWVGVTATDLQHSVFAAFWLQQVTAKVKYISYEPLLEVAALSPKFYLKTGVNWLIIGAQTKPTVYPRIEWVEEIVKAADRAGIPIFLKNNLLELVNYKSPKTEFAFNEDGYYRQEMPE
jgi:protein gp37